MRATLTIGSLFSGIGGLELGVESATGGRVLWQVERDGFCREVLAKHWPDAVRYDDVCTVNELPRVDVICGGFPCQDVSLAGKRAGFGGERSSLWREYRRIVADVRPRFVFVENVPGLFTADDGWAFGEVLGDLAALGFDAAWDVFRASDVGAPHRRERLFALAYRSDDGCFRGRVAQHANLEGAQGDLANGRSPRGRREGADGGSFDRLRHGRGLHVLSGLGTANAANQPGVGRVPDGVSHGLDDHQWPAGQGEPQFDHEPARTASDVPLKARRIRALGNAVVPQCAALAWRVLSARVQSVVA